MGLRFIFERNDKIRCSSVSATAVIVAIDSSSSFFLDYTFQPGELHRNVGWKCSRLSNKISSKLPHWTHFVPLEVSKRSSNLTRIAVLSLLTFRSPPNNLNSEYPGWLNLARGSDSAEEKIYTNADSCLQFN